MLFRSTLFALDNQRDPAGPTITAREWVRRGTEAIQRELKKALELEKATGLERVKGRRSRKGTVHEEHGHGGHAAAGQVGAAGAAGGAAGEVPAK